VQPIVSPDHGWGVILLGAPWQEKKTLDDADTNSEDEASLLRRWQDTGDTQALDQLLRVEILHLKTRLRAKRVDRASMGASDFADEVVLKLLRQEPAPHFDSPAALRGYLFRAARNLLIDRLRVRRGDTVRLDGTSTPVLHNMLAASKGPDALELEERRNALEVGLNLLSEDDRKVLRLTYLEEKDGPEVAQELNIAPEALRMRLVRARRRLGKLLVDWQDVVA